MNVPSNENKRFKSSQFKEKVLFITRTQNSFNLKKYKEREFI